MLTNAFIGKREQPTEDDLARELGQSKANWDQLLAELESEYGLVVREWSSFSPKYGWALRLKREKRNIIYLSPAHGAFYVSFALGDRALAAARQSRLPKKVVTILDEAKRYAEGTAVRIDVNGPADFPAIRKLTAAKLAN